MLLDLLKDAFISPHHLNAGLMSGWALVWFTFLFLCKGRKVDEKSQELDTQSCSDVFLVQVWQAWKQGLMVFNGIIQSPLACPHFRCGENSWLCSDSIYYFWIERAVIHWTIIRCFRLELFWCIYKYSYPWIWRLLVGSEDSKILRCSIPLY